ncbi:MAG: PP2C family protein-serine/threonine phosphatase [Planctomycetota bacterium]|jgi:serine phosphatase RsbU (regulator of sigma subunit)
MAKRTKRQIERDEQIYQLTTLVAGEFSLQEVLDKLAEAAVKIVAVKACSIRLLDEKAEDLQMRSTYGLSEQYRNKGVVSKNDTVVKAAFAGEAVVLDDMRVDGRVKYKEATIKEGLVSQLTVAMQFRNKAIGILRLYSPRPRRFDADDIQLARAVASQCAVAITNAKLYAEAIEGAHIAEQMRLAGVIQRRMIPEKAPQIAGLDIAATYIPCFDVGGDLYGFLQLDDNSVAVVIADVIGKGIPAAIMMSSFRGALQAYIDTVQDIPAYCDNKDAEQCSKNIIDRINKMVCDECKDGEFITLFHAVIDVGDMTLTYCNCGHEPTVLIRDGQIMALEKGGLVLGVDPQAEYEIETIGLKDDDCLLFYTDGLIDAANFDGELWGRERMLEAAKKFIAGSAEQMIKNMLGYRRRFVGLARQIDDTSIVVVKTEKIKKQNGVWKGKLGEIVC